VSDQSVDIGDMMRVGNPSQDAAAAAFTSLAGTPTDPTAVSLTIVKPDGAHRVYGWPAAGTDGTLSRESAGRFSTDIVIDQAGTWRWRIAGVGAVTAASEGEIKVKRSKVLS
jgi:uncharacterized protein YfaP (DUF2135 family)